jgi:ubiquinone/menaquinone biosynthesis C-methylase UbiE
MPGMEAEAGPTHFETDWHLKLFRKSLLKQAKLAEIVRLLGPTGGQVCLDVGGDNGVIPYYLRQGGGEWHSADLSEKAVQSMRKLLGDRVHLISGPKLPFQDAMFDAVVIIDLLEHLQQDAEFIQECHRVMKPAGRLIVNVPHVKRRAVLPPLRRMLGLTDDLHGHVRPGYTQSQLYEVLKDGFNVEKAHTYSRFFVESVDTVIQFMVRRANKRREAGAKGVMIDEQDFAKMEKMFRAYSLLYPFFWLAAQLDVGLFFTGGYSLIARATWRPWRPRRSPVLADGRSIAEAALGGRIGTAAPF